MFAEKQPIVSIAMTVFNSAPFLAKSLESLLAQDYDNFELIISDNASNDGSSEICQNFAKRDKRIKYYRNTTNMGLVRNRYKAIDLCSGDFIMPAADHDIYHPRFISSLLELLQKDDSVVLAYPRSIYIDENDQLIELLPDVIDTRGMDVCQRFSKIIWELCWMNMIYGLYRGDIFRSTWHVPSIIGFDHIIAAKLSLHGTIAQLEEALFFRRRNRPVEDTHETTKRQISLVVNSSCEAFIPWTMMAYEHVKVIADSELANMDKELLYCEVRRCFPTRFGDHMQNEVAQLLVEAPNLLSSAQMTPDTYEVIRCELARVSQICRFFYPEMAELDTFLAHHTRRLGDEPQSTSLISSLMSKNTKHHPSVTVVIPTHNRANILTRAVISALRQTYPIHEVIIADDGSTDNTESVVRSMMLKDNRIQYVPKSALDAKGAQAARNRGVRVATGDWIAFLDSDDEFLANKIEKQMAVAQSAQVAVVHCECFVKRGDLKPELFGTPALSGNIYKDVLTSPGPTFPALMVKKEALEAIGLLDQEVPSFQEWDTVIRLAKKYEFGYVPEPLYMYHCHQGETISKDMKRHAKGYAYIVEKHTVDMLRYGGTDVLLSHYRSLIQQAMDYDMPSLLQIYKHKFIALSASEGVGQCAVSSCSGEKMQNLSRSGSVMYSNQAAANEGSCTRSLGYISAVETVSAAKKEGLSVCDYVEKSWGQKGCTQSVIEQMESCGVFTVDNPSVLEIGTGTGRYLEKTIEKCTPSKYESYETAEDWAEWLQANYPIISHRADGMTLAQTSSLSVDILQAHGVFVYLPFLVSYRYWKEMWRVVRGGGYVVFDVMSESCFDDKEAEKWLSTESIYPTFVPSEYLISVFGKQGFSLINRFYTSYSVGKSEYFIFRREK